MSPCIEKLVEISGVSLCDLGPSGYEQYSGDRFSELLHLCVRRNGFYAFESALHIFPISDQCGEMTLQRWNAVDTWKVAYDGLVDDIVFFAEDIVGDQFGIAEDTVVLFRSETGEIERVAGTIEEWACAILTDYENLTGWPIAHEWQVAYGPIPPGMRLTGKRPFILGGAYDLQNLYAADGVKTMRLRGDIYGQIRTLPDGTPVRLRVDR